VSEGQSLRERYDEDEKCRVYYEKKNHPRREEVEAEDDEIVL
jgi:hypothetical protein